MKELEYLPGGNDFVDAEGDVQSMTNYYPGIEHGPKYPRHMHWRDGVDATNEADLAERNWNLIGAVIDGLSVEEIDDQVFAANRKRELAQVALFELPGGIAVAIPHLEAPASSEQPHELADNILAEYRREAEKNHPKLGALSRAVHIAVIRNIDKLSVEDLKLIAKTIGRDAGFYLTSEQKRVPEVEERAADWFERQQSDY